MATPLPLLESSRRPAPRMPALPLLDPRQQASLPLLYQAAPAAGKSSTDPPPLSEEEHESLLGTVLGGVEALGNVIGLPGSSLRDVALGENPFDQWLTPLTAENRVSGREFNRRMGWAGDEDTWGNFLGGIATEVVSDLPLTMITGPLGTAAKGSKVGAVSGKAARAASRAGRRAAGMVDETMPAFRAGDDVAEAATWVEREMMAPGSRPKGHLPTTPAAIGEQIRRGERGVIGLGNPITRQQWVSLGAGNQAAAKLAEAVAYGESAFTAPIRWMRGLFSPTAGAVTRTAERQAGQAAAKVPAWAEKLGPLDQLLGGTQKLKDIKAAQQEMLLGGVRNLEPVMRARREQLAGEFLDLAKHHGQLDDPEGFATFARLALEAKDGIPDPQRMLDRLRQQLGAGGSLPEAATAWARQAEEYFATMQRMENTTFQEALDLGLSSDVMGDIFISHHGRRGPYKDLMRAASGRKDVYRHVPMGTVTLNRAAQDPLLSGIVHLDKAGRQAAMKQAHRYLKETVGLPAEELKQLNSLGKIQDAYLWHAHLRPAMDAAFEGAEEIVGADGKTYHIKDIEAMWREEPISRQVQKGGGIREAKRGSRLTGLRKALAKLPEEAKHQGIYPFNEYEDWVDYMEGIAAKLSTMRAAHQMLAEPGVVKQLGEPGTVPLTEAWKQAGFTDRGLSRLAKTLEVAPGKLGEMAVGEKVARALSAYQATTTREVAGPLGRLADKLRSLYSTYLTTGALAPSFFTRNFGGGLFQEMTEGRGPARIIVEGHREAVDQLLSKGKRRMEFADEVFQFREKLGFGDMLTDLADDPVSRKQAAEIPTSLASLFTDPVKKTTGWDKVMGIPVPRKVNPLRVRGWYSEAADAPEQLNLAAGIGGNIHKAIEFVLRGGYYNALRKAGYTPDESLFQTLRSHFDYSRLSEFERRVARRGLMFYGWRRHSIPYTMTKILERPFGRTSQAIRAATYKRREASGRTEEDEAYTPAFLRERMGTPIGSSDDGSSTQFLKQLGLPYEDIDDVVSIRDGLLPSLYRSAEKFTAQTNPLLTGAVEALAGRQLYTGRPLKYLEGPTGNRTLDAAIAYSPLSRYASRGMSLTDERKSLGDQLLNELTGLKVSDYDTEKWRQIDALQALQRQAERHPNVRTGSYQYVPDDLEAETDPAITEKLTRIRQLQRRLSALKAQREASAAMP